MNNEVIKNDTLEHFLEKMKVIQVNSLMYENLYDKNIGPYIFLALGQFGW